MCTRPSCLRARVRVLAAALAAAEHEAERWNRHFLASEAARAQTTINGADLTKGVWEVTVDVHGRCTGLRFLTETP